MLCNKSRTPKCGSLWLCGVRDGCRPLGDSEISRVSWLIGLLLMLAAAGLCATLSAESVAPWPGDRWPQRPRLLELHIATDRSTRSIVRDTRPPTPPSTGHAPWYLYSDLLRVFNRSLSPACSARQGTGKSFLQVSVFRGARLQDIPRIGIAGCLRAPLL